MDYFYTYSHIKPPVNANTMRYIPVIGFYPDISACFDIKSEIWKRDRNRNFVSLKKSAESGFAASFIDRNN